MRTTSYATLLCALLLPGACAAADSNSFGQALAAGHVSVDYRLRNEHVVQEGFAKEANALTGRLRITYATGLYHHFSVLMEADHTTSFGGPAYNSTRNGNTEYPVIADPAGTALNQAYLQYLAPADSSLRVGRQRIIFNNARFIGNVGWRQNEQTFDGALLRTRVIPGMRLTYAYLTNVNTVSFTKRALRADLLNAQLLTLPGGKLTLYGYWLNFGGRAGATRNTRTLGARFTGALNLPRPGWGVSYALEYAEQSPWENQTSFADARYYLVKGGVRYRAFSLSVAREVLGGNGHYNFQTPLATKHAFNGWADVFLPDLIDGGNGLRDNYAEIKGKLSPVGLIAVYHDFAAAHGDTHYGHEWDVSCIWSVTRRLSLQGTYAAYRADHFAHDVTKYWLAADLKF